MSMHSVFYKWEGMCRQTGRTRMLIDELTSTGCVVVVHKPDYVEVLKQEIRKYRPDIRIDDVKFIVGVSREAVRERVKGLRMPVFIDHHVFTLWNVQDIGIFNLGDKMNNFKARKKDEADHSWVSKHFGSLLQDPPRRAD